MKAKERVNFIFSFLSVPITQTQTSIFYEKIAEFMFADTVTNTQKYSSNYYTNNFFLVPIHTQKKLVW